MTKAHDPAALRCILLAKGFEPIAVAGKRPVADEWQAGKITNDRIRMDAENYASAVNTGLRTGHLVGVDIDVEDPGEAVEVKALTEAVLGPSPFVRVGRKGMLLAYRNATPIRKITAASADATKVEILGAGQQFVAYGDHPDTGKPYRWVGGAEPATRAFDDLPAVTAEQIRALAPKIADLLRLHHPAMKVTGDTCERREPVNPGSQGGIPFSAEEIAARLRCCDPACGRDEWRDLAAALHAMPCTDPNFDKLGLFTDWSRAGWTYTSDEDCALVYESMAPKEGGLGAGTFVRMTNAAGYTGPTAGRDARPAHEVFAHAIAALTASGDAGPGNLAAGKADRFRLIFPTDMRALPEPTYVVDGIVPEQGLVLLYGASGSLKTFAVLDILASVAAGQPAFKRYRTRQGPAILCAGEAPNAVARSRWPAFSKARGITSPDEVPFAIVRAVPLVSDPAQIGALIAAIEASGQSPRIIALDTVARAAGGMDENDARAAGFVIAAAEQLRDAFGCAVILVHHSGKDENKGARGSSALAAGVDTIFRVSRAKDTLAMTLRCEKMKDADEPDEIHLQGEAIDTSLAFHAVSADEHLAATRSNPPLSPGEVGKALQRAGASNGVEITTRQLAVTLLEPAADEKTIANMEKRLRNAAEGRFAAYVASQGQGRGTSIKWTFPALGPVAG